MFKKSAFSYILVNDIRKSKISFVWRTYEVLRSVFVGIKFSKTTQRFSFMVNIGSTSEIPHDSLAIKY